MPQFVGPRTVGRPPSTETPSFVSPEDPMVRFAEYRALNPQSQNVVSAVQQPAPTGIAGGTMVGLPEVARQFPSQAERAPMAPITADITGTTERRGVRTAYGMVYPTAGQEAAAQQLAMRRPMEGRLQNVREGSVVRPQMVTSAISEIQAGRGAGSLEGLTQAEKIAVMRQRGRQIASASRKNMEREFKEGRIRLAELRAEEEKASPSRRLDRVVNRTPRTQRGGQTRQRSWSDYTGDRPIANFEYEDEETRELAKNRRRTRGLT
jgi:hypothetical protein